jgi:hypothetical protein
MRTPFFDGYAAGPASHILAPPPKNREGQLGPICSVCDGWGFVIGIKTGGSCKRCSGSGIQPIEDPRIAKYVAEMRREILALDERAQRLDPGLSDALRIKELLNIKASRQFWEEQIWWVTASGTAVAATTSETIIFPNVTIPANYMQDGRTLRIRAQGQHSTLGSGTVTLTFRLRWGGVAGTAICITAAITQLISLTAAYWDLDVLVQTRSNGSTGTLMGNGIVRVFGATAPTIGSATGAPAIAPMTNGGQVTPAVATVDLTSDTALSLTVQHGANSSSNTLTGLNYNGESLN